MFKPVKSDIQFPKLEEEILAFWRKEKIIQKGLAVNQGKKPYVFYDGPPFATGLPHYGHLIAGTLKDIVPRYWAMKGYYVERRWGWDCHGLPVEFEMENQLGLQSHKDVEEYGVAKFNDACKSIVARYTKEWEETVTRTARWVDFENQYRTMDAPFMETVWWVLRQLWDKGLVYEGFRVMPYSWRIATPLSNFEAGLNYKEVQDPSLTIKLKSEKSNRFFLAWTTTPWTLPANLALAASPDLDYVEVEDAASKEHFVLAEARLGAYFKDAKEYTIISKFKGTTLEGESYIPLFPYFKELKAQGAFKVVLGDHVTATDGTGLVHTAPAHGDEDFQVAKKYGIPLADATDHLGNLTEKAPEFKGLNIKDADKEIIKYLKGKGSVLRHETINHNYPFCWRSDTPLMNKAIPAWFVKLDPIKKDLIANNVKTHWVPEHLRDGRFGNWLENARDWNISRNRFWGTPIPIWRCNKDCGGTVCVGSMDELHKLSGKKLTDIHKQFVDEVEIPCPKCKKGMKRIPEVLDCWFESGSMPYGQVHYPFENKEKFDKSFPADFIAEGIDQTRGWFYTLSVISTALFNKPPFKHVIVNGLVLAEDGKKMSKRLKNYPDPKLILDTYGADAMRTYLMTSPASHADDLRFSEAGVKEIVRSVLLPYWNAYSFFLTYARADEWSPKADFKFDASKLENDLDKWVYSRLHTLIKSVDDKMANYHLYEVVPEVLQFIDELTNWYIRLNRRRFWAEDKSNDKELAYSTLYHVLVEFSKVLAPIVPYITDGIFQNLKTEKDAESVHLSPFPSFEKAAVNPGLENQMALIQNVVSLGRTLRSVNTLKTRQPLLEFLVITKNPDDKKAIEKYTTIISQELNVKKVSFTTEETKWVNYSAKANAKVLGPKLGQKMKVILQKVKELPPEKVAELEKNGSLIVEGETITLQDVTIERQPKQSGLIQSMGSLTVWVDTTLTPELIQEGQAREFVNRVQKLRKDQNFDVSDRIQVKFQTSAELSTALKTNQAYICDETLCQSLESAPQSQWTAEEEIDGTPIKIWIAKA